MFYLLIILCFIVIAGLALFNLIRPFNISNYEEKTSIPIDKLEAPQQKGQLECLLPNSHSH